MRTLSKCHKSLDEVFLAAVDSKVLSEEVCQQVEFLLKESDKLYFVVVTQLDEIDRRNKRQKTELSQRP